MGSILVPYRCLRYDRYRGVVSLVSIQDGVLRRGGLPFDTQTKERILMSCNILTGDKIASCHTRKKYEILEIGLMHPEEEPTDSLQPGQVGYVACNMKESSEGVLLLSPLFTLRGR